MDGVLHGQKGKSLCVQEGEIMEEFRNQIRKTLNIYRAVLIAAIIILIVLNIAEITAMSGEKDTKRPQQRIRHGYVRVNNNSYDNKRLQIQRRS